MWEAIFRVRYNANQIEADLAARRIDLNWWHRLTLNTDGVPRLSSRKLLVLLDRWPTSQQMLKTLVNETSLHRASLYAGGDNEYAPTIYMDPLEQQKQIEALQAELEEREKAQAQIYGDLGWG